MAVATNQQIQQFVDQRVRPRSEQIRALLLAMEDDRAAFDDIYEALNGGNPGGWTDTRPDGPPHLLTASDVLAWNTFLFNQIASMRGDGQLPIVEKACVRPLPNAG